MKKLLLLWLVALLSNTLFAQTDVIKEYHSTFNKAMVSGSPSTLSKFLHDSTRLMPEFQKTVIGKDHALAYYQAFFNRFEVKSCTRERVELLDLGSQQVELGTFSLSVVLKATQKAYTLKGKYQEFWKLIAGKAELANAAWNYDHAVEIPDQLRFAGLSVVDVANMAHLPVNSNISFELAALNSLQESVIMHHDAATWKQFFTSDAKYIYSASPVYSGTQGIGAFLDDHVKYLPIFEKLDIRNDRIEHLGKYVIEYASHTAIIRNGDFSGVFTGKNVNIWRREADGSLKIYREMAMYD